MTYTELVAVILAATNTIDTLQAQVLENDRELSDMAFLAGQYKAERDTAVEKLSVMVDGYEKDTATIKQLQEKLRGLEAKLKSADAIDTKMANRIAELESSCTTPDCRTCRFYAQLDGCWRNRACIEGNQYQEIQRVVLWASKDYEGKP